MRNEVKQIKRLMHKCSNQITRGNDERALELFKQAWEIKCTIGEHVLIVEDFNAFQNIYYLRTEFADIHKPYMGDYYDAEYAQLQKQENDPRSW